MNPTTIPDNILDALNFSELEEAEQMELLLDLHNLVFQGTFVRLLERMSERTRAEFTELMEQDAPDEVVQLFIEAKVPNADEAALETIEELTSDILAITRK